MSFFFYIMNPENPEYLRKELIFIQEIEFFSSTTELPTAEKMSIIEIAFSEDPMNTLQYLKKLPEEKLTEKQLFFFGALRVSQAIRRKREKGYTSPIEIRESDIWFASSIELAKRGANSFKEDLLMLPDGNLSRFGLFRTISAENNLWSDHGRDHFRRVERYIDDQIVMIDNLRTKHTQQWLDGLYLFPEWHDVAQILRYQRNTLREQQGKLPYHVKVGHELEAIIILLTLVPEYAKARGITESEAKKQITAFAFMCMGHDEKRKTYEQAITSTEPARQDEPIESLYKRYKNGTVDRRTISYRQIFALYRYELETFYANEKKSEGYASPLADTTFGLDPDFEEEYGDRLQILSQSNESIFPITSHGIIDMDHESFMALQEMSMVALRADRTEFLSPGFHAVIRKLMTQYSQHRLLFGGDIQEMHTYAQEHGFEGEQDLSQLTLFISRQEANLPPSLDSDTRRSIFELFDMAEEVDPYLREVSKDSAILYAITFKEIIPLLMRPNKQTIEQIDGFFLQEAIVIGKKLAGKYSIPISVTNDSPKNTLRIIQEALSCHPEANTLYQKSLIRLEETRQELYRRVSGKPKREDRPRITLELSPLFSPERDKTTRYEFELYSMREVLLFKAMMRNVLKELQERFAVDLKNLSAYYQLFDTRENPKTVPYKTYYGTNLDPRKAKRIAERHCQIDYLFTPI